MQGFIILQELKLEQNFAISIPESLALASQQKAQLHENFGVIYIN